MMLTALRVLRSTAARLEALNKDLGTRLLVSVSTVIQAGEAGLEPVGTVEVRGQSEPSKVFTHREV